MRAIRMFSKHDTALRLGGLILLLSGWLLIHRVGHSPDLALHHDVSILALAGIALAFLCFSAGSALATLGAHVLDHVETAERWTPRHDPDPRPPAVPQLPARPIDETGISSMFGGQLFASNVMMASAQQVAGHGDAAA